jgi:hypothetical protein
LIGLNFFFGPRFKKNSHIILMGPPHFQLHGLRQRQNFQIAYTGMNLGNHDSLKHWPLFCVVMYMISQQTIGIRAGAHGCSETGDLLNC